MNSAVLLSWVVVMDRKSVISFVMGIAFTCCVFSVFFYTCLPEVDAGSKGASGNGDVNASGRIDLADGIYLLTYLFDDGPEPVAMDPVFSAESSWYWSSSSDTEDPGLAWYVHFDDGYVFYDDKDVRSYVRAVRG